VMQFLVTGFFLLDAEVLRQGAWWMSNSFNYLWPLSLGLLAVVPFVQPAVPRALFAATIPAAAYAASQEQAGLLLLGAQALLGWGLWRRRGFGRWHGLQVAASAAAFAVVLLSPGSASSRWASGCSAARNWRSAMRSAPAIRWAGCSAASCWPA
jgi:hypothetical protein